MNLTDFKNRFSPPKSGGCAEDQSLVRRLGIEIGSQRVAFVRRDSIPFYASRTGEVLRWVFEDGTAVVEALVEGLMAVEWEPTRLGDLTESAAEELHGPFLEIKNPWLAAARASHVEGGS
jgi:hypothetical protein